jgi:hypothetical protein
MGVLGTLVLVLGLAACAGSSTSSESCCPMCSSGTTAEGKAMKCDKKEHSGGCCSKGGEGKSQEGHQH